MTIRALLDGEIIDADLGGDRWLCSWHGADIAPEGTAHGSSAMCVTALGQVVLVTSDAERWDAPGGRPKPGETWAETLCREVLEEACASVITSRLVGFSVGKCIGGRESGLTLVRSLWRANVELAEWKPSFEMKARRIETPRRAWRLLQAANPSTAPLYRRWFEECGLGDA